MPRLHTPLTVSLLATLAFPGAAYAGSVCVAKADTPFVSAPVVGEGQQLGFLASRQCFGVLERLDGRVKVLVKGDGFRGEALIAEDRLLYEPVSYTHLTLPTNREV